MRRILIESARLRKRLKHGGELERVDLDSIEIPLPMPNDELLALDESLDRLAKVDLRSADWAGQHSVKGFQHERRIEIE